MTRKNIVRLFFYSLIFGMCGTFFLEGIPTVSDIGLSQDNLLIYTGYDRQIYLLEYDGMCKWMTDDAEIATVSEGIITAGNSGKTVIRCITEEGKTFSCEVEVRDCVSVSYHELAEEETAWLEALQLSDGSFSCYQLEQEQSARINPYFSSYAALAVLKCDHKNEKKERIDAYLDWYFLHMNAETDTKGSVGTVYDYQAEVQGRTVISETCTNAYDSADSYAAVFLMLLWEHFNKYQDYEIFYERKEQIDQLVDLLLGLQSDGYTESMQASNIKYLMNNMEAYQGMQCALNLYDALWKPEERTTQLERAVVEFQNDFDEVWWNDGYYYSVLEGDNRSFYGDRMDWDKLYEFAAPQLFPVMFGVKKATDEQSEQVYSCFCKQWDWKNMQYEKQTTGNQTWSLIAYAAMIMGDYESVDTFLANFKEKIKDRSYPYYSGDSVWVVLACEGAFDYYTKLESQGKIIDKSAE